LLVFLLAACTPHHEIKKEEHLFNIPLQDMRGSTIQFSSIVQSKLFVIIFLSPECPICKGYSTTMRSLWSDFKNKDVQFAGVIPGTDFTNESIDEYRISYKIPFELFIDYQKELTNYLHATVTPQCFVTDTDGKILYCGKIDDYAVAPGVTKQQVTQHYLIDALNASLADKKINITKTEPAGCFIQKE